mgnify:CR=1 FL=1
MEQYQAFRALMQAGEATAGQEFYVKFYQAFIYGDRWQQYISGVGTTLMVTAMALAIGIVLGVLVAMVRTAHDQQRTGKKNWLLGILNGICQIYVTVIRGTPMMVQLLIMGFVVFASSRNYTMVGALTLGINSGAYVAEILRGGIMSLDQGQFEGARSLGLTHGQTMRYIILPQTFKNTLPALANEFIVLIKETAISGYIGLQDLTMAGNIIRSNTYQAFLPLITVAVVYLIIVMFSSAGVQKLEKNLKKNERHVYD